MEQQQRRMANPQQLVAVSAAAASAATGLGFAFARRRRRAARPTGIPRSLDDPRVQAALGAAREALESARDRVETRDTEQVRRRVASLMDTTRVQMPMRPIEMTERARLAAERLRQERAGRATDLAPAARQWAQEALAEAEQILSVARQRAGRMEVPEDLGKRAAAATGIAGAAVAAASQALGSRLGEVARRQPLPAVRPPRRALRRRPSMRQRAGRQTRYVLGQTTMILFWVGALGAAIYYGILSPERRERVRGAITGTWRQVREMMGDFRGDDMQQPM